KIRTTAFAALLAVEALAQTSLGQTRVTKLSGKYCAAAAPEGWTVTAENPAGTAFGADLTRRDGAAIASYSDLRSAARDAPKSLLSTMVCHTGAGRYGPIVAAGVKIPKVPV